MAFRLRSLRSLTAGLAYRRLTRVLERHAAAQEATNVLLARLVERFAPPVAPVQVESVPARHQAKLTPADRSDISHLDPDESQMAEDFIVSWTTHNGQPPTDDEVFAYVSEQQTLQLAHELNEARRDPWSR